jgi:predicted Fe-Mo cluster-binding NifX family protein
MRIAVATDDGHSIAGHFGRCAGFEIFDTAEGTAVRIENRPNTNSHHHEHHEHQEQATCGENGHQHENHGHESFLSALHDCQAVICRGMGRRAVLDLANKGIKPLITGEDVSAAEAVELFINGKLQASSDSQCCSHS